MENLGIDPKLLLAQIVNFALVFFIFKRFIAAPFSKFLNQEKEAEAEKEKTLKDVQTQKEKSELRSKERINEARGQALKILNEAKVAAVASREESVKKLQQEIEEIREKNKKQLADEREKMLSEVRAYVIKTSAELSKETLKDFINEKRQQEIIKTLLSKDKKKIYEN